MYLQGNLDPLFNVLDSMNYIDDVLKLDWQSFLHKARPHRDECDQAVEVVNQCGSDLIKLEQALGKFSSLVLKYLAIEVGLEMLQCEQYKSDQIVIH